MRKENKTWMPGIPFEFKCINRTAFRQYVGDLLRKGSTVTIEIEELSLHNPDLHTELLNFIRTNADAKIISEDENYLNAEIEVHAEDVFDFIFNEAVSSDVTSVTLDCCTTEEENKSPGHIVIWIGVYENADFFSSDREHFEENKKHFLEVLNG